MNMINIQNSLLKLKNIKASLKEAIECKGVVVGDLPLSSYPRKVLEIMHDGEVTPCPDCPDCPEVVPCPDCPEVVPCPDCPECPEVVPCPECPECSEPSKFIDFLNVNGMLTYTDFLDNYAVNSLTQLWKDFYGDSKTYVKNTGYNQLEFVPLLELQNPLTLDFSNYTKLRTIPSINTSRVTSMSGAFMDCSNLEVIPPLNTYSLTTIREAFKKCSKLKVIPYLNTLNVKNFYETFFSSGLTEFNNNFNMTNGNNISRMFFDCIDIKTINITLSDKILSGDNLIDAQAMFSGCRALESIIINNTHNISDFRYMFSRCDELVTLETLDFTNAVYIDNTELFTGLYKLQNIKFARNSIKYNINFNDCSLLTNESIESIVKGCNNVTSSRYIYFNKALQNKITVEQKAELINKGWTLGFTE